MKVLSILFIAFFLLSCKSYNITNGKSSFHKDISINEEIEWSHTWMVSNSKNDLPRVLIIGDSHVEAYYPLIAEKLMSVAYCCKFTTSRSLGDPVLIEQLKVTLRAFKFDIISFNNGLHGGAYSDNEYKSYIPVVYQLFKSNNPTVKLVWVNSTARRVANNLAVIDTINESVVNRNRIVSSFVNDTHIPLVNSYQLSFEHPEYYLTDGVHFNANGVQKEADGVAYEILNAINAIKNKM